jgi:dipeptidyl aminopeptidase/acylaminoacyl peptidase
LPAITVDDLYQLGWLETPAYSPDGRWLAYVRVTVEQSGNRYRRSIWIQPAEGGPARRLTAGDSDADPRWKPDGQAIAFVSSREGGKPQIFLISTSGGEARRLTSAANGASDPAWSPNGRRIAFLARVNAEERALEDAAPPVQELDAWEQEQEQVRRAHAEEQRLDPRVISRMPYRSGTAFFDDRRDQLYVIDVPEDDEQEPGRARRLTDEDVHFSRPAWMPDGTALLTTATRDPEADSLFAYYDIVRVPVPDQGRAASERLTRGGYSCFDPRPAPDGSLIAFMHRDERQPLALGSRIAVIEPGGGPWRDLTFAADLDVEEFRWSPDGRALFFTAGWWGEAPIYRVDLAAALAAPRAAEHSLGEGLETEVHILAARHEPVAASAGRIVNAFDVGPDGSLAFVAGSAADPCELFVWRPGGEERQLTQIGRRLLSQRQVARVEQLRYAAPDELEVQGWVLYPPGFDPARSYPLAVHIHGGPHVMWGPGFRSMWHELQVFAAAGYITFFCNPRGSEGYGRRWRDAIHGAWSTAALDIQAGIDALIARGGVDEARIAVTGGSYGGYMTAWLVAHSDRFCAAVAARGVYDLVSFHGTSDAHELIEFEFDGFPWENRELLWAESPLAHAHRITTPLLILHAEQDYRVPISQAEQLFSVLRRRKVPTELVRYPREGHELTRSGEPRHRADHMRRTLEWFERYCGTPSE